MAGSILRDTRDTGLSDKDRFNYFPASPLVSVTCILFGELRLVAVDDGVSDALVAKPLPALFVTLPQTRPTVSWSPGDVLALTVGFYPDAWLKLGASLSLADLPGSLSKVFESIVVSDLHCGWDGFCNALQPTWDERRSNGGLPDWPGSSRLSDWSRHLLTRIAMTSASRSVRTVERRMNFWTNRSKRQLEQYAAVEDLHRRVVKSSDTALADLAVQAGFSDQSHMGRMVLRTTGFSPAKLNRLIDTAEPFWCYRLLGERF